MAMDHYTVGGSCRGSVICHDKCNLWTVGFFSAQNPPRIAPAGQYPEYPSVRTAVERQAPVSFRGPSPDPRDHFPDGPLPVFGISREMLRQVAVFILAQDDVPGQHDPARRPNPPDRERKKH